MRRMPRPADEPFSLTPLIDIAFLMLIFFMSLPFKGLDARIEAYLPPEGTRAWRAEVKDTVRIRVRKHGDACSYALGQHTAASAIGLEPVIRALGPAYAYEIDAAAAVPWQWVIDAVDMLLSVRCTDVRFTGGPPLTPEMRRRR